MKKLMLILVALLFSANFALADDYACDEAYAGTCLENVSYGPRQTMTTGIDDYPGCEILIYYVEKTCTDALGNYHVAFQILWWEINKTYPASCIQMYEDLWDENLNDWDQVKYEQVLVQIDQAASDKLAQDIADGLPGEFFKCSNNQHFIEVTTTKVACYSNVAFRSMYYDTHPECQQFITAQVRCGDYGCCYHSTSYCRDANGDLVGTPGAVNYVEGANSGCGLTPPMCEIYYILNVINLVHPGCDYELMTFLLPCHQNCE